MSEPTESPDVLEPIPVKMEPVEQVAPEFGAWFTVAFGAINVASQVLPQTSKRHRAVIIMTGAGGTHVQLGTREQVQNNAGAIITMTTNPIIVVIESQSALFASVDALATTVVVLDERYR